MEKQLDEVEFNEIKKRVIEEYNHTINEMKKEKEMYMRKIEYFQQQIDEIEKNKYQYCFSIYT
jgi:prefoldin subunit 5